MCCSYSSAHIIAASSHCIAKYFLHCIFLFSLHVPFVSCLLFFSPQSFWVWLLSVQVNKAAKEQLQELVIPKHSQKASEYWTFAKSPETWFQIKGNIYAWCVNKHANTFAISTWMLCSRKVAQKSINAGLKKCLDYLPHILVFAGYHVLWCHQITSDLQSINQIYSDIKWTKSTRSSHMRIQ